MRHSHLCLALLIASLVPATARATDTVPKGKQGETSTSTDTTSSDASPPSAQVNEGELRRGPGDQVFNKWWQLDAGWETHVMLLPYDIDHEGAGSAKFLNFGYLAARAKFLKHHQISARFGMSIYDLADSGESGVRASDLSLTYTFIQNLPKGFGLRPSLTLLAPTSFHSIHDSGLIMGITPSVAATYAWKILSVNLRVFGSGFIQQYRSALAGAPNPKGSVGWSVEASVEMPFYRPLAVGASFFDEYFWMYYPATSTPGTVQTTTDGTYGNGQPTQQSFGLEGFADLRVSQVKHVVFDIHLAYALGDPQLGAMSVVSDGVQKIFGYGPVRTSSSVYLALVAHF